MSRRGFTLLEMLLAIGITSLIAVAVAMMLLAVSSATADTADARRLTLRREAVRARITHELRGAAMVLDADADGFIVVWREDADGDGLPRLSEIARLEWSEGDETIVCYSAPASIADGDNTTFALVDDFDAETAARAGTADFPGSVLATTVTGWSIDLDDADPTEARLVGVEVALEDDAGTETLSVVAALRASSG